MVETITRGGVELLVKKNVGRRVKLLDGGKIVQGSRFIDRREIMLKKD
jgi:hypothetical protein